VIRGALALITAVGLGWAAPALAWWDYGHATVARIAEANVRPATRAAMARLLRAEPGLGTPTCPAGTLVLAAGWADCIRRGRPETAEWHFQNEDLCRPYDPAAYCPDGNCVTAQVKVQRRRLADRKLAPAARLEALAFLVHFVGDVHQPLHMVDHAGDGGGSGLRTGYGAVPRRSLHVVWDGLEAERAISAPPGLVRRYGGADRRRVQAGTVADWGRESFDLARAIYPVALGTDPCAPGAPSRTGTWDNAAIARFAPLARERVRRAGLRLARLLDEALARPA
jgi:hypothetical protein